MISRIMILNRSMPVNGIEALRLPAATLPPGAEELREEVRSFLRAERDTGGFVPTCDAWLSGFSPELSARLGERGWIGMCWPRRYGGGERSALERFVVTEELLAAGAPVAAHWVADRQSGPALLRYGSEELRARLLPAIARGQCFFAIGMSEPDSGSDLASVRTTATPVDGGWRLEGTKVWTSHAHHCHYMILLARTSPRSDDDRHGGLSQFVVDLGDSAVSVNPIRLLDGGHHFNEVVLDGVVVPGSMLLGQVGAGWAQVTTELAFERSGPERFLSTLPMVIEMLRAAGESPGARAAPIVGRLVAELWTLRQLSLRVAGALERGEVPDVAAAIVKDLGTRFENETIAMVREAVAVEPSLVSSDPLAKAMAQAVLHAPGFTLRGGTNEILRGIVARGLGLR